MRPGPLGPSIYAWDLPAMSEDCLSLNIWTPKEAKNAPVFVWIHGGALTGGSGGDPIYDGSALAERGIVVVRSEEHTSELQSLMRISYAVFCLKKKKSKTIWIIRMFNS